PLVRAHWTTSAPSAVEKSKTSRALPLLRFTSTYQAAVSTVAADAGVETPMSSPAAITTATAAANPDRHRRRHLTVRADPTDMSICPFRRDPHRCGPRRHPRTESTVLALT